MSSSSFNDFNLDSLADKRQLSWARQDIECRFGFNGGRYTRVNMYFTGLLAVISTVVLYVLLFYLPENAYSDMFTQRGITPYPIVFFGFWTFYVISVKSSKINFQRRPLKQAILPMDHQFVLTSGTAEEVIKIITDNAETPKDFLLYRRILLALSNLKNLGRVTDVDDILRSQADQDTEAMETSYTLVNGFLWAIPILGFIGTVLGLSSAIGSFGGVLGSADADMSQLIPSLKQVTGGLSTAFETTLVALVIALILQLYAFTVRKKEEELLDDMAEYCSGHVVSRLRMDFNETGDH